MILSNLFWSKYVHTKGYKNVLKVFIMFQFSLPLVFLLVAYNLPFIYYNALFFLVGLSISAQKISIEGILYEITTETNRALYSGVYGALSITISLFPLFSGILMTSIGFTPIFIAVSLIASVAFLYLRKLQLEV